MKSLAERTTQKLLGDAAHLTEPRLERLLEPRVPPFGVIFRPAQFWVERERDVVDIAGRKVPRD
jgi:hypothetical protein